MSTTFGIKIKKKMAKLYNVPLLVEVAHRHNIGNGKVQIDILNPLVLLLPDYINLEAIDNTAQGITSVGNLKKAVSYTS